MGNRLSSQKKIGSTSHTGSENVPYSSLPKNEGDNLQSSNLKSFTFSELKAATRNFRPSNIIGEGNFGSVFKGWVDENSLAASTPGNGMVVAVKRLKGIFSSDEEWLAQDEITYLGQLRHPNLVKLIGYCLDHEHKLLVYEFMLKGSLDNHLYKSGSLIQPLSWGLRMKIALGAARGLAFLHAAGTNFVSRDFETSSILLDSNYNGKLSYFRLARDGTTDNTNHAVEVVMGNFGYLAPEYIYHGRTTTKGVVYIFGVVLVEILTGKKAVDRNRPPEEHILVKWAKPILTDKRRISSILDPRLEGQYSLNRAVKAAKLARQCLCLDPKLRPTMDEVVTFLEYLQDSNKTV